MTSALLIISAVITFIAAVQMNVGRNRNFWAGIFIVSALCTYMNM